jgi:hypothetical protein
MEMMDEILFRHQFFFLPKKIKIHRVVVVVVVVDAPFSIGFI